jgi:hypothetical protein
MAIAQADDLETHNVSYSLFRYTGDTHGANASKLAFYPLLREILDTLNARSYSVAICLDLNITRTQVMAERSRSESNLSMAILSGHDTVIAPILGVLGVPKCGWPPCAWHSWLQTNTLTFYHRRVEGGIRIVVRC